MHPRRPFHKDVVGQGNRRMAHPFGIELVLHLQQEFVIIGSVFGTGEVKGLMGTQQRRVRPILDVHLGRIHVELVHAIGIVVGIPVYQKLRISLVPQFKALEPSRIAVVGHERRVYFFFTSA